MTGLDKTRRIAIADASESFRAAAATYVAGLPGYELAGAAPALEALALIESVRPDVLLLDLGLAPARALEFVRQVKAAPRAPAVIALTLFHSDEMEAQAGAAGADALVGKESFVTGLARALVKLFPAAAV